MAAIIRSLRNGVSPVIGASRDDLVAGDVVTVNSVDTATTYSWSIAYKPPGSAAVFSGSPANATPGSFAVDVEGPYLVRLIVDLGLPTEDEQFVRLRYLTVFGDLRLVAAGEQYGPISIPVDAPFTGWADEQNYNLRTILGFVAKESASGRLLYVDANTSTEGYGNYATIQAALNFAAATATATTPWVVAVRPGTYTEDLTLRPNVHVVAWPGSGSAFGNTNPVLVRGVHTLSLANAADVTVVGGMNLSVHLATTSPGLTKTGPGNLIVSDCRVSVDVSTPTQGPALRLDAGPMSVYGCSVVVAPANPITTVGLYQAGGTVLVHDTDVQAPTGIFVPPTAPVGTTTTVRYSRVTATGGAGATALRTDATSTTVQYSVLTAGVSPAVSVHPGGGAYAGAMTLDVQWSRVSGTVAFDTTGIVGASTLTTGAVTHGGFVFPGGSPTLTATVRSDSVFYDNTASGLTSADAQGAIDELVALLAPFTAGYTLGQAYNGGGPGAGRTIVADSGSVRILDGAFPSDPVPAGNTNGNLEVVGKVSVGALTKPEIDVDPNPYGTGPRISMGWTVVPNNSPTGVGMATVVGRSTEAPLYRNYDLRLGTMPASGGGKVGDVVVRAGDGTQGGATTPNPGSVYVLAGSGLDGTANRGNVILSPGVDAGGNPGAVVIADPRTATPASVTAAGVCSSPVGVTGTITFATDLGAATASINAVDTLAVVVAKLDALLGLSASSAAGIVTVSSRTTGPSARVYFLSASAGLDAALGTFDGQSMTAGTYPDYIAIQTTASNEVTFGANGATGPLVYNADTGKLTVPGLIDPTGMVFEEAAPPGTGATQGAVFVSDGTGGLTLGDLYYQGPGSAIPVTLAGGAGGSPTVTYVYRPGGVAAANVYTDFNLLYTAMSAVQGPKAILFDDTGLPPLAPINIPPKSGGGFYSFRNVSAYGIQLAPGSTSFPGPIVRFHNDGVNQAQCDSFFDYSRCIAWVSNALAGLPAVVLNDVNKHVVIADNCAFTATGAAEFFQVDGGGGFPVTFLDIILRRTSVVGAASRSFRAINAGSINVSAFDSPVGSDTLATDATSYISVAYDALTLPQATQPGCAAGTYDFTARAEHLGNQVRLRDVLPGSNTITLGVTGPNEITIGDGAANPMVYDAVTGKLTVPGVIDPTALILSDPAAGTDLYLESADGQTAAVAPAGKGRIRYNNTSAQWEQATNGGAYTPVASTTAYVYRPGGTASGNVYTDFNLLYTAMSAVQGPKAILFDDTGLPLLTPVDIPPKSGGGFYSFRGVSAYGIQRRSGGASALVTVRFHNDGVNQAQCDSFFDYSRYVGWVSNTLAGFPAVALSDTSTHYVTLESSTVTAVAGTASFFYVDGGGGIPSTALIAMLVDVNVVNGTAAVFQAINSGFIALNGYRTSNVFADTLASDASSSFEVYVDANSTVSETQTSLTIGTWSTNWLDSRMAGGLTLTTPGPGGDSISVAVTGPNQITIGSGAANPMIYDAVTGKLTVPGVIDPTALILEAAATPATGATEGAIFVSDGTGGLASGSFYLRPPSNGTPLDLTGTVASGTDFYANVWPVWKKPCRVATTANVTSFAGSAPLTVDGVNVTTGDRVLVTVQTAGAGNGIYRVTVPGTGSDGTWVRDDDFNASSEVVAGLLVYVQEGSQNGRTRFTLVTTGTINLGVTALDFIQEAPLVRTDATSTAIIAAGTAFTSGTFIWSSAVDMRDYSEISVWFGPTNLGSNTQVDLYVQWSDDGSTIPFDNDNGIQQTDFLLATGSTGVFQPKNYVARLTTAGGELVVNAVKMLSFPKKGGSFRFGVVGNSATGTFGVRAQRLA